MEKDKSNRDLWYREGLRFECQRCGACCSGPPGIVEMTESEAYDMAQALHIDLEEFRQTYTRLDQAPHWMLREVESSYGYDCIMLERDKDDPSLASCKLHKHRPQQCRTWPFWPENLRSPRTWASSARRCPGMNLGPLHTLKKICENRDNSGTDMYY